MRFSKLAFVAAFVLIWSCAYGQALDPRTYGVRGDGVTDDTAAWAAMVSSIPDYSLIQLPTDFMSKTGTIDLSGRHGFKFTGSNGGGGGPRSTQSTLIYSGAVSGALLKCAPCADMSFEGFVLDGNNLAGSAFQASYGPGVTTQNVSFYRMNIDRDIATSIGQPNFRAIDWCSAGVTSNCEALSVRQSNLRGSGVGSGSEGVRIGHSNAVSNEIEGNFIEAFGTGIAIVGMTRVVRNLMDSNGLDIACESSEPIEIAFNRTENGRQFFRGDCPINMHDNRFGSMGAGSANAWISNGATSTMRTLFANNVFTEGDTVVPFGHSSGSLVSINNRYSSNVVNAHRVPTMQFDLGYSSLFDEYAGGNVVTELRVNP